MTYRPTMVYLTAVTADIRTAAAALGLIGPRDTLTLHEGSKVNGASFRLYWLKATDSGAHSIFGLDWGYLGETKREAMAVLEAIRGTLQAVYAVQANSEEH